MTDISRCRSDGFAGKPKRTGGLPRLLVLTSVVFSLLAGCVSTQSRHAKPDMPEGHYVYGSKAIVAFDVCLEHRLMNPKLHEDVTELLGQGLSTWSYDKTRWATLYLNQKSEARSASLAEIESGCKGADDAAYTMIKKLNLENEEERRSQVNSRGEFRQFLNGLSKGMNELSNSMNQTNQQMIQSNQQMIQSGAGLQTPQIGNPFGGRNTTNCVTVGRNTNCNHSDGSRTNCVTVGQNTVCN